MIILAVKRQKTYTGAPTFKACFHFSCVNISYACASCLCYCVLLTMITFFWSLSLLQDLKHRTKLEGIVAAREGNLSLLLILTYCLFKSLSSRILNFSLCLQCLSHITYKLDSHTRGTGHERGGTFAVQLKVACQLPWPVSVSRHFQHQSATTHSALCTGNFLLTRNGIFFYDFLYLITSVALWIPEMDQLYCTVTLLLHFCCVLARPLERMLIHILCSVNCPV